MKDRGITRDELSASSGYSAGIISRIRKGHDLSSEQLLIICQLLNASPNHILGFSNYSLEVEFIKTSLNRLKNKDLNLLIIDTISLIEK